MEARAGFAPTNSGFADRCLTTWLSRRKHKRILQLYILFNKNILINFKVLAMEVVKNIRLLDNKLSHNMVQSKT